MPVSPQPPTLQLWQPKMSPRHCQVPVGGQKLPLLETYFSKLHFSHNESNYEFIPFVCLALLSVQSSKNMFQKINSLVTRENSMKKWMTVSYSDLPQALIRRNCWPAGSWWMELSLGFSSFDATCSLESWGKFFVHFFFFLENVKRNTGCKE